MISIGTGIIDFDDINDTKIVSDDDAELELDVSIVEKSTTFIKI
jgi:hypothetical protein